MNCSGITDSIDLFLDGALAPRHQMPLFAHLGVCGDCSDYLAVQLKVQDAARWDEQPYPSSLDERVLQQLSLVRGETTKTMQPSRPAVSSFWKKKFSISPVYALAASVVVVFLSIAVSVLFFDRQKRDVLPAALQQTAQQPTAVIVVYGLPPVDVVNETVATQTRRVQRSIQY